jgi:hypothetical protein
MARRKIPKPATAVTAESPKDRPSTRIRAFLSVVMPLRGCCFGDDEVFLEGRSLIEGLAVAYEVEADHQWDLLQIAAVVRFLNCIEPVKGVCYCGDTLLHGVSLACGHQAILDTIEDELRRLAEPVRKPKRAAEVANA